MHDITAIAAATPGATRSPNFVKHQRWYPTIYDLRRGAARRLPHFAYEYGDGGAGDDTGIKHNWAALDADRDGAALRRHAEAAAGQCRAVRPQIFRAARRRPDGQPDRGLARRRQAARQGGAARARSLYARRGRRRHHRGDRRDRPRRDVAAALSLRQERPCHRLRSDAARGRRRRPCADADARRAGAHHALARGQGRHGRRRRVQAGLAHGRRHGEMPRLGCRRSCRTPCRALPTSSPMPARTPASTTPSASPARRWAARSPGTRSSATATAGSGR